jgi:hypothetical protein
MQDVGERVVAALDDGRNLGLVKLTAFMATGWQTDPLPRVGSVTWGGLRLCSESQAKLARWIRDSGGHRSGAVPRLIDSKRTRVQTIMRALASAKRRDVARTGRRIAGFGEVRSLIAGGESMEADTQQVVREFLDLSAHEKEEAREAIEKAGGLPAPTGRVGDALWLIVVSAFVIVLVGGGWLLYDMSKNGQDTSVILPIITTVLGALVGLMAPSPVQEKNRR